MSTHNWMGLVWFLVAMLSTFMTVVSVAIALAQHRLLRRAQAVLRDAASLEDAVCGGTDLTEEQPVSFSRRCVFPVEADRSKWN